MVVENQEVVEGTLLRALLLHNGLALDSSKALRAHHYWIGLDVEAASVDSVKALRAHHFWVETGHQAG